MTPLYKVLTEGNKPSLPRFIGNWIGFFNPDAGLISRMQFLRRDLRRSCMATPRPGAAPLVYKQPWIPASPQASWPASMAHRLLICSTRKPGP